MLMCRMPSLAFLDVDLDRGQLRGRSVTWVSIFAP
jgi:hypothetical protein